MNDENIFQLLVIVASVILFLIIILIGIWVRISLRERKEKNKIKNQEDTKKVKKSEVLYTPESVFDFMDFEKIEDNMIIQKKGKFLMIVECQGINYDLMSEMEKVSVEQGFISFLNTLRYPIQLYIQSRTINLERSIDEYKSKLNDIERKYNNLQLDYEKVLKNKEIPTEELDRVKYEMVKQKNLKEYTQDIIRDIERQSLNKSILSKKYYVIIPCYQSEIEAGEFDKSEVKNMAFSELYTRARAIINSLFACQVTGKILNSEELTELLYIAYNRDESDLFWVDKMRRAGFGELYSTSPDVLDKKSKLLDKEIEQKSIELANEKISEAKREKELRIMEKEKNEDKIVNEKAKELIKRHKKYVGEEIAKKAINKLEGKEEKESNIQMKIEDNREEVPNVDIQEKRKRGRPRKEA